MARKKRNTPKIKASTAFSRYIRLRDALKYCRERGIDTEQFARPEDIIGVCCTCGTVKSWIRMDAGHFKGRGIGGGSGTYFDERNVHLQCKPCNGFEGGRYSDYEEFIIVKYGQPVHDELILKHHIPGKMGVLQLQILEQYYKDEYKKLVESI